MIGIGRMGVGMAVALDRAGSACAVEPHRDHGQDVARRLGGAAVAAGSVGDAVDGAKAVITSLADDAAVAEIYTGDGGLGACVGADAVVLEMSTIAPATVLSVAPAIDARAALLDAPVSGSVGFAESGELTIMAGGDVAALERARPVLDALSKRIFHLGPLGAGATMKLAVNSLLHGLNVALSEALVLAERAGSSGPPPTTCSPPERSACRSSATSGPPISTPTPTPVGFGSTSWPRTST